MKGLYAAKSWYTSFLSTPLNFLVKKNISPNTVTIIGLLFGLLAGVCVYYSPLSLVFGILAGVFLALRLAGANLDGALARKQNSFSPTGFVINEFGDRFSDIFAMFAVFLLIPNQILGGIVLICSFLPSFVSLCFSSLGVPRINGGPFGKTERCLTIFLASLIGFWWLPVWTIVGVIISLGSVITFFVRFQAGSKKLNMKNSVQLQ